jgi:hypothetical protein
MFDDQSQSPRCARGLKLIKPVPGLDFPLTSGYIDLILK